jgi:hypothetical protein
MPFKVTADDNMNQWGGQLVAAPPDGTGAPATVAGGPFSTVLANWNTGNGIINAVANILSGSNHYSTLIVETATPITAGGNWVLEGSCDNINWLPLMGFLFGSGTYVGGGSIGAATNIAFNSGTQKVYQFSVAGFPFLRQRLSTAIAGSGTVVVSYGLLSESQQTPVINPSIVYPSSAALTDVATPLPTNNLGPNGAAFTSSGALAVGMWVSPGAGGGNNSLVALRTPSVFRGSQFSAAGANVVWMPPSTKKVRLMKYKIEVSADATITGGAAPINLQWAQQLGTVVGSLLPYSSELPYTHRLVVPSAAQSSFLGYDSGWIDLGNGALSPTAGRALQMGIQVPQSTAAIASPTWTIASNQWEAATVGFKTSGNTGAFKLVQTSSNASVSSVALPALQMVTGNSYFVFFRTTNVVGGVPTVTVTDTALNTYTTGTLVTNASDGANGSSLGVAYIINAVGNASNTITVTTSVNLSTVVSAIVIEYAGLGSGGIDAAQVGTTGNSTSPASGAYTPATAGDVVFTFMATAATLAAIPTAPAAFTLRGVPFTFATGGLAVADNFGNGSLATGVINVITAGTEE